MDPFTEPDALSTYFTSPVPWNASANWSSASPRPPSPGQYRCTFQEDFKYVLLPLTYWLCFALGAPLNGATLWIFLRQRRRWNFYYHCMFHLIVSDTLYTLSLPLLGVYYALGNHWPFGGALCSTARFTFYFNMYTSIMFLACISAHRYLKVRWSGCPKEGRVAGHLLSARAAPWVCAAVWVAVLAQTAPIFSFTTTKPPSASANKIVCPDTTTKERFQSFLVYSCVTSVTLFALPLCSILASYCMIVRKLRGGGGGGLGPNDRSRAFRMRTTRLIFTVMLVFSISFVPFHVTRALYYALRGVGDASCDLLNAVNTAYKVTRPLASANCCLDPLLFVFSSKKIRAEFLHSVRPSKSAAPRAGAEGVMEQESALV
ncbi:P2Y purinoceptor 2-like [Petromyzon marinus]|uniref:P2Y purinoceptor 2-like n=1 Tax=Petromyzon marinus TaxID=7757 RepID=UPI003F70C010